MAIPSEMLLELFTCLTPTNYIHNNLIINNKFNTSYINIYLLECFPRP